MSREGTVSEPATNVQRVAASGKDWPPDRVKALRLKLQLNQEKFGDRVGVKRQTVGEWETGKAVPSDLNAEVLDKIDRSFVGGHVGIGISTTGRLDPPKPRPVVGESHVTYEISGSATGTVTDPRQSLAYWLGRLEEAGGVLEDATARHGRIRAEMAQALTTRTAEPEELEAATSRQLAKDGAVQPGAAREA